MAITVIFPEGQQHITLHVCRPIYISNARLYSPDSYPEVIFYVHGLRRRTMRPPVSEQADP